MNNLLYNEKKKEKPELKINIAIGSSYSSLISIYKMLEHLKRLR